MSTDSTIASQGSAESPAPTTPTTPSPAPVVDNRPMRFVGPEPKKEPTQDKSDPAPRTPPKDVSAPQEAAEQKGSENPEPVEGEQKRSRRDSRIDRLTREKNEYLRQATFYRTQFEELSSKKLKPLDPVKHASDDDWGAAVAENTAIKSQQGFTQAQAELAQERADEIETQIWLERSTNYAKVVPDFEQVVYGNKQPIAEHVLRMIRGMDEGPAAAYYLAKNPAELQRLSRMNPMQAAFELGGLDKQLKETKPRVVTKAPAPPPTVNGRTAAPAVSIDKMTPQQYSAWKRAQNLN